MFSLAGQESEVFCGWHAVEHNGMTYEVNGSTVSLGISVNVKKKMALMNKPSKNYIT